MDKSFAIKHLHESGNSQRQIAKTRGVSRGAVRRHLAAAEPVNPNGTTAPTGSSADVSSEIGTAAAVCQPGSSSQCESFRQLILEKLEQGLHAKRIYQDLVAEHDFQAKYWSVARFVKRLKATCPLPFRRLEVLPGSELQVDFGTGAKVRLADGKHKRTHVFRAVLSHSRKGYSEACFRQTTEDFIRCLENAFWHFGGVPEKVIFDNAKCAVKTADWYDPELNPKIIDFCKHYGCAFIPTRPYTPRHKGKVERGVDYVQENALRGREFDSLEAQNEHLFQWEARVADTRIHGTTQKQVKALFEAAEKPALKPLPAERFAFYHEGQRRVSRDGHIAVNRSYYSVPPEYLGCDVWVRWDSRMLRILDGKMNLIATHVVTEPGRHQTNRAHLDPRKLNTIENGVTYFLGKIKEIGPHAARWSEAALSKRGIEAVRTFQGLLALCKKYQNADIDRACDLAWRQNAFSYRNVQAKLQAQSADKQATMPFMDSHPIIPNILNLFTTVFKEIRSCQNRCYLY